MPATESLPIRDLAFRAAVAAIQSGDEAALATLLDADPGLLTRAAVDPGPMQEGYFADPKLFWFIANNPTLIPASPPNIASIARLMIARGVAQGDLDYALALVTTNQMMPRPMQVELAGLLLDAGAVLSRDGVLGALGHAQSEVIGWMVDHRAQPLDALTAAGLGRTEGLALMLASGSDQDRQDALALATINQRAEAVRLALAARADPNRFMTIHKHSTPLHQAALAGDLETMSLLIDAGARLDVVDTMWNGTPMGWAMHGEQPEAQALLRARGG